MATTGTIDITVNGKVFPCPAYWTVEQAKTEIRSAFLLAGGYIQAGRMPLLETQLIGNTAGALSFAWGQPTQQGKTLTFVILPYLSSLHLTD